MSSLNCPNCQKRLSLTVSPNSTEGYFVSEVALETLDAQCNGRYFSALDWASKNGNPAYRCFECGFTWRDDSV